MQHNNRLDLVLREDELKTFLTPFGIRNKDVQINDVREENHFSMILNQLD